MVRVFRLSLCVVLTTCFALSAFAGHTHVSTPSTWELDPSKSDFGGGPTMKSDVMTIMVDTEKELKFEDAMTDANGTATTTSWEGPQDGTPKPIDGLPGGMASFNTADDSSHWEMPDGSKMECNLTLSDDKKVATDKCTMTMKDGKAVSQTLIYNRTK